MPWHFFLTVSLVLHALPLLLLLSFEEIDSPPAWTGQGVIVEIVTGSSIKSDGIRGARKNAPLQNSPQGGNKIHDLFSDSAIGEPNPLLTEIRAKIERAKRYPALAKKLGVQGRALVQFRIGANGLPQEVRLQSSSGSPLLDEEALATIKRAAPFRPIADPTALEVAIRFELPTN